MAPKLDIEPTLDIEYLLSHKYDPGDYKPAAFHEQYQSLVKHRDDLQKQHNIKEEKRASIRQPDGKTLNLQTRRALTHTPPATFSQRNRFSSLPDDDDGSSNSSLTKPTPSARLSTNQLDKLFDNERKAVVAKIKQEIAAVKEEMKKQRRVVVAKTKGNEGREEVEDAKEERQTQRAVQEDHDETNEPGQDRGWETVKSSLRR